MEEIQSYKHIQFSSFKNLGFWDYYTLTNQSVFNSNFRIVKLNTVLKHRKQFITIDNDQNYKRCRVQLYGNGVVLRDIVKGALIKTKKQQLCKTNDFLVAEIDAKFGGYGIVPPELEDAIVSGHYFLFEIDKRQLLPDFLALVVKCGGFSKQVKATGSTNYAAIRPYHVLDYKIPLPPIDIQENFVKAYNEEISKAEEKSLESQNNEQAIEDYFLQELELPEFEIVARPKGLNIINYRVLDRWDFFSANSKILLSLSECKYDLKTLESTCEFVNRSWNSKLHPTKTFRYIEIGAIDPVKGILEAKEVETNKAPSRATQTVKEGDLIIATTRPYLKKFVVVPKEYDGCVCSSGFSVIKKSEDYNSFFIKQFLTCSYGIEQLKSKMTGALYPAITDAELKKIKIPFPTVTEQNQIMELVDTKSKEIVIANAEAIELKNKALKDFENTIFNQPIHHEN